MNEKPEAWTAADSLIWPHLAAKLIREKHAENERLQFERDALLKVLRRRLRWAEWADKYIYSGEEEAFQNWVLEVRLPVPLSEPDKSPEAAFQRFVAATLRREET